MTGLRVGRTRTGSVANVGALVNGRFATMEGGMLGAKVGPVVLGEAVGIPPRAGEPDAIGVSGVAVGMPPVVGELDAPVADRATLGGKVGPPAAGLTVTPAAGLTVTPAAGLTVAPAAGLTVAPAAGFTVTPEPDDSDVDPTKVDGFLVGGV
jgi:hypothetical protein